MRDLLYSSHDLKHFSGFNHNNWKIVNNTLSSLVTIGLQNDKQDGFNCFVDSCFPLTSSTNYSVEVMSLLQEVLKIRVSYKMIDNVIVSMQDNTDEDVDLFFCHPPITHLPNNIGSLFPTLHYSHVFVYKTSTLPLKKDLFMRNLTGNIWFYLVGVLVLLALCFRISTFLHSNIRPQHHDWSWLEVTQWTLGAICQQGSSKLPQGCSCRTMFLIGYCITYMIFTGFAAGLTSLLAVKPSSQEIQWHKVMELNLPFVVLCNSESHEYLKENKGSGQSNILKCVNTVQQLMEEVKIHDNVGLMSEIHLNTYLNSYSTDDEDCSISFTKQKLYSYYSGFFIKRGFPFRQQFNYWLLRLKEHGLLKRLLSTSVRHTFACQMTPKYIQVGLEHVNSVFEIMIFSLCLAIVIFCLEYLFFSKENVLKMVVKLKAISGLQFPQKKLMKLTPLFKKRYK